MKKLIASNFELDLSNYEITTTETNPWFADAFTSRITYPFEIPLTDELDVALGFLSRNTSIDTFQEATYYEDDTIHKATLEILGEQDGQVQMSYEYGLEEFPLWETKLAALPLQNFPLVGQNMYQHAISVVDKVWPEVNYTFPAVHTPLYNDDDQVWGYFEGLINNYRFGEFLVNTYDAVEALSLNANVLQPFPSLMYIMNTIAQTAGYTLAGNILTDQNLLDNFVYSPKEYFNKREPLEIMAVRSNQDPDSSVVETVNSMKGLYETTELLTVRGKYSITGYFRTYSIIDATMSRKIFLGTNQIYSNNHVGFMTLFTRKHTYVDIEFDFDPAGSNEVNFQASSILNSGVFLIPEENIFDFTIALIAEYDAITGTPIPSVRQLDKIDLRLCVPDMTVGELITALKNWHNYDYSIEGTQMIFNKIQDNMDFVNLISLEEFEVKSKPRKFQQGMSFLLKFADTEDSKFVFEKVYQDFAGVFLQGYTVSKKTNTIEINALPLPMDRIRNFETANAFELSENKLYIVRYRGLSNGRNATFTPEALLIPQIHASNFAKWFNFRINAMAFKISFKAFNNQVKGLNSKSKIFMYNKLHYIKSIIKTQTTPENLDIEIESESLK